jgi:hypothetical protein
MAGTAFSTTCLNFLSAAEYSLTYVAFSSWSSSCRCRR